MKALPSPEHPLVIRHNARFCRIARARPGHKARHQRHQPRPRDIDFWRQCRGKLSLFHSGHGPGPIDALRHAVPIHMFPLSDRLEQTRLRAKGIVL